MLGVLYLTCHTARTRNYAKLWENQLSVFLWHGEIPFFVLHGNSMKALEVESTVEAPPLQALLFPSSLLCRVAELLGIE